MLFQSNNLFPHLTIFRNVALAMTSRRWLTKAQQQQVGDALDRVGLSGFEANKAEQHWHAFCFRKNRYCYWTNHSPHWGQRCGTKCWIWSKKSHKLTTKLSYWLRIPQMMRCGFAIRPFSFQTNGFGLLVIPKLRCKTFQVKCKITLVKAQTDLGLHHR